VALVILYLDGKIPKRYGGHMVEPIKMKDMFSSITKDGKPLPSPWEVRQKRIKGLRRFLLWTIAVVGIVVFVLRKLRW
jgi:hypothetical protein